jgi:hypothetical protein
MNGFYQQKMHYTSPHEYLFSFDFKDTARIYHRTRYHLQLYCPCAVAQSSPLKARGLLRSGIRDYVMQMKVYMGSQLYCLMVQTLSTSFFEASWQKLAHKEDSFKTSHILYRHFLSDPFQIPSGQEIFYNDMIHFKASSNNLILSDHLSTSNKKSKPAMLQEQ